MNHGGIEYRSASNSLEGALEKWKKAIIRGTDPSRFRQITKISQMASFSNSRSGLEDQGSGDYDKTEAGQ